MSVVIRLMRAGAKKRPFYRMVVADSRRQRDGRFIEILGHYNPLTQPFELVVHKDLVEKWLSRGAQPSEQAASLLRSLGITPRPGGVRVAQTTGTEVVPEPVKKPAKSAKAAKTGAKKPVRAAARKVSERKARRKQARKTAKKAPAKAKS